MDKSLKERLLELRKDRSVDKVYFYNDGTRNTDEYWATKRLNNICNRWECKYIKEVFYDNVKKCTYFHDFDYVTMDLLIGLVYDANDVDENNNIKENAKPLDDIVRYYTDVTRCYLNNEQQNPEERHWHVTGGQGFAKYSELVKSLSREDGLTYNGQETFQELKEALIIYNDLKNRKK